MLKSTMTLYVFGNEHLPEDRMAREVASHLDADLVHCRSPDDLLDAPETVTILDVVKNIDRPVLITDVRSLKMRRIVSLHDFDLGTFLTLLREIGMAKTIKIIGVPAVGDARAIAEEVTPWLKA